MEPKDDRVNIEIHPWVAGVVLSLAIVAWAVERVAAAWRDSKPLFGEIVTSDDDEEGPDALH